MKLALVIVLLLALGTAVEAGITSSSLAEIGVAPPANARVPLQTAWRDERGVPRQLGEAIGGRPTLLIFADFTCSTLCGPVLAFAVDALGQSGLQPGSDYRLVVLGLDPKDGPEQATKMKRERIGDGPLTAAVSFLSTEEPIVRQVADALGYRFAYDAERDQFAHPAAAFAVTADGRVARVLSGLGIDPGDVRLALVEAGEGRVGTLSDRVRLLCYGFDPTMGAYTLAVRRGLAIVSAITVLVLAGLIGWMSLQTRHRVS